MRCRRDEADGVEHRAAADRDDVGMAVDALLVELALHRLDEMQLDLDLLAAGDGDRIGDQGHALAVPLRVGMDLSGKCRADGEDAFVDEHDASVLAIGLQPAQHIDEHRVLRVEDVRREDHREFVSRR